MDNRLFRLAMSGLLLFAPLSAFALNTSSSEEMSRSSTTVVSSKENQELNIKQEVEKSLMADKEFAPFMNKITIKEDKGVVTLDGKVNSSDMKSKIGDKVKMLPGVVKVINNLEVETTI